jgi:hypothetical protein
MQTNPDIRRSAVDRPQNFNDLDGRLRVVKRAKAIERSLIAAFASKPAPHQMLLVRAAAEMSSIAEQTRADHIAGGPVSLDDVVRTQGAMARAIKALQLPTVPFLGEDQPTFVISADDALL